MNRKLVLLNLALVVLAAGAAWQLRQKWLEGKTQEQKVLRQTVKPLEPPPATSLRSPQPASAAAYSEVAQKTLFSPDRNPDVVVEVAPPKPVPPFPVVYGVMDLGDGPTVILSEKSGAPSRAYLPGERVGEFKLLALEQDEIVLEWEGKQFRKKLRELKVASPAEPAPAVAAAPAPAAAPVQTQAVTASSDPGPGAELNSDMKACVAGDTAPAGAVRSGYRKVLTQTPFGYSCNWERIK